MTPSREPEATEAYTRASVEAYLRAATDEKARLQEAIAEARKRVARAQMDEHYLISTTPSPTPSTSPIPPSPIPPSPMPPITIRQSGGSNQRAAPSEPPVRPPARISRRTLMAPPPSIRTATPRIAQLRMTPGAEDIWRYLDFPSALAHE